MFVRSMLMLALVLGSGAGRGLAQEGAPPPPPGPAEMPPPSAVEVAPQQPTPQGQWVNTAEYGWVFIPLGSVPHAIGGLPYAYLYTPAYGWTWYASPWGWGPFVMGDWVARPAPYGYRAWVRGPRGWGWYHGPRASIRYVVPHPRPHYHAPHRHYLAPRHPGAHYGGYPRGGGHHRSGGYRGHRHGRR